MSQLEDALHSRIVIEQAKGVLASAVSWTWMRRSDGWVPHARNSSTRLAQVAQDAVNGQLDAVLADRQLARLPQSES